jgi:hypothetical protein
VARLYFEHPFRLVYRLQPSMNWTSIHSVTMIASSSWIHGISFPWTLSVQWDDHVIVVVFRVWQECISSTRTVGNTVQVNSCRFLGYLNLAFLLDIQATCSHQRAQRPCPSYSPFLPFCFTYLTCLSPAIPLSYDAFWKPIRSGSPCHQPFGMFPKPK